MRTEDIILVLDNAKRLRNEVQEQLKEYVHDKNIPLVDRFSVWVAYCDKKDGFITFLNRKQRVMEVYFSMEFCDEKKEALIQENCSHIIIV